MVLLWNYFGARHSDMVLLWCPPQRYGTTMVPTTATWSLSFRLSLKREGRLGTTDDFANSFLHFSMFSTALLDLPNSRPVHSLMLSSHLFLCLCCLLPPFTVPCKWFWPDLMNGVHDHTTAVCISLQWSGLRVLRLPAGS